MEEITRRSLEERLEASEARTRRLREAVSKQKRRRETQRKIVMGAMVLTTAEDGDEGAMAAARQAYANMRERDQVLFTGDSWRNNRTNAPASQGVKDASS